MVFDPAPSADAFGPDVPAAPAVPPVIADAWSRVLVCTGVVDVRVGKAVTCVTSWIRCCALVVLDDWATSTRRMRIEQVVPGLINASVLAPVIVDRKSVVEVKSG